MLAEHQKTWLKELSSKSVVEERFDAQRGQRDAIVGKLQQQMAVRRNLILGDLINIKVSDGKNDQRVLDYGARDQTEEFDLDEIQDGFAFQSDADLAKFQQATHVMEGMLNQLNVEVDELDDDGNPVLVDDGKGNKIPKKTKLIPDEDLAEEFYTPMVRQGLMPETMVPNEHSKTKAMIKGSFDSYKERLKKDKRSTLHTIVAENFALTKTLLSSGMSFAGSVTTINKVATGGLTSDDLKAKWDQFGDGKTTERFTDYFKASELRKPENALEVTGWGFDLLMKSQEASEDAGMELGGILDSPKKFAKEKKEAIKKGLQKKPPARAQLAVRMADVVISSLAAEFSSVMAQAGLGITVATKFTSLVKPGGLAKIFAAETVTESSIQTAVQHIAKGFADAMIGCDPKTGPGLTNALLDAGKAIKDRYATAVDAAAVVKALTEEEDGKIDATAVVEPFLKNAAAAVGAGQTPELANELQDPDKAEAMRQQVGSDLAKEFFDEERKSEEEWAKIKKEITGAGDAKARAGLLERRIAEVKRDEMWLKWTTGLAGMAFDIASKAVGPIAIAGGLMRVILNVTQAVKRYRDLWNFVDKQIDLFRAASAFSAPVANFIDNAAMQAMHYTLNAALEVIKLLGSILSCTGVDHGAGLVVSATATGLQAIEAVLYEAKKRLDLEIAWRKYKQALNRPENRKLALVAMKKNPTLAKYAVAWGAVIAKEPLVEDFLGACGLDEETLKDPNANVDKVVVYLEARMPDDNVVTGRKVGLTEWAPGTIELTMTCWALTKHKAHKDGRMKALESRALDAALTRFEEAFTPLKKKVDGGDKSDTVAMQGCVKFLLTIDAEFGSCRPLHADSGVEHREMKDVMGEFRKQAKEHRETVEGWLKG